MDLSLREEKIARLADISPLKEVLRYVMVLIGLRANNWPAEAEKAVLIDFIISQYGGHTPAEIRLAFTMAIEGKLGVEVNCYENFSVLYFAGIMNAYREWSKEAVKHLPKKAEDLPALPPVQTTDEEFIQAVLTVYRLNRDWRSIPLLAYKTLEGKMGLTRADKQRIYQRVHETTKEGDLRELCQQYAVKEYFDKLIQEGTI